MQGPYRLYGAELSPSSMKVRAYLQYKAIPFEWIGRSHARQDEVQRYAKAPLLPILVGADETVLQDSTPTIEALEADASEPSLTPDEPATAFVAALIEDYADEWLNKLMYHYRWSGEADQESAARRLVDGMFDADAPVERESIEAAVRERMTSRLRHIGAGAENAPILQTSFARLLDHLDAALASSSYLLGGRPSIADFGLAAQLEQMASDPTAGALIQTRAPNVARWLARMRAPRAEGGFDSFDAVTQRLAALAASELAGLYLPWAVANAAAVGADAPHVGADTADGQFRQPPQRYAARALAALRAKYARLSENAALAAWLGAGAAYLAASAPAASDESDSDEDEGDEE